MSKPAIILLSGGLDSATTLAIAAAEKRALYALSFDYGQRHAREVKAASDLATHYQVKRHVTQRIDLRAFGGSALTADIAVPKDQLPVVGGQGSERKESSDHRPLTTDHSTIPVTYVPARNTVFLSFALAWAESLGIFDIYIGVNAVDYSGYPDCRPEFVAAFEKLANVATKAGVEGAGKGLGGYHVITPLISLSKADIIRAGLKLGVPYQLTHSCYDPSPEGKSCGHCDSCLLRLEGFKQAGVKDPVAYV
jgi:7-cyano-7-deazaguanine synthase